MTLGYIQEPSLAAIPAAIEDMARFGIRKISLDYFYYGKYGYPDLKDAIAQARKDEAASFRDAHELTQSATEAG